ncbi:MAG TPA: HAMP domain-containing sensor histidine kinase [Solirubrobacteraceae bacterium]|nr:HAMP domain-containing sensor histidine kinase [Solirubrobacteraceae bacterium]
MRALSSIFPTGLRWRLTAWVATVMLASAAVIFVVVYEDTGSQLQGQIDRDVVGDTSQLAQALRPTAGQSPVQIAIVAARYLRAQPYTASSTLLFVLLPGARTASNHLEVFGASRPEPGESAAQQAFENGVGRRLLVAHIGYWTPRIPDVGRVRVLERSLDLGGVNAVVGAGEPLATVAAAQHDVAGAFVLAGAVVLALALLASYLAGARVSAPLRRLSAVAARVDAGDLGPRMTLSGRSGDEMRVLAGSFNHMLDRLAEAFASQREFVADAAHELRTPLTVIRGQLEVLATQQHPSEAEVRRVERLVQAEVSRISRLVDDLLVLTQAERIDFLQVESIDLRPFVAQLWDGLSLTADRRFELGAIPDGALEADPDRLAQALRNLARNAIEHTADGTGLIRLDGERLAPDRLAFVVIDDGPGIPVSERDRIFERFHRIDGSRSRASGGAGLGLAIVRAIAEAHGGQVRVADRRDAPGARIELVVPGFTPKTKPAIDARHSRPYTPM